MSHRDRQHDDDDTTILTAGNGWMLKVVLPNVITIYIKNTYNVL